MIQKFLIMRTAEEVALDLPKRRTPKRFLCDMDPTQAKMQDYIERMKTKQDQKKEELLNRYGASERTMAEIERMNEMSKQYIASLQFIADDPAIFRYLDPERGVNKTVRAIVVGVPNVGKSTLINRLYGSAVREVSDRPGVTRANQWVRVSPYLEILDTPGLLWPRLDDQKAALRLSYIAAVRDDVQDVYALAISLLDDMMEIKPEAVTARFKVSDSALRGQALLDAACLGRGFLLRGGEPDEERGCRVVLEEFRSGKLGRITLESAPEAEA